MWPRKYENINDKFMKCFSEINNEKNQKNYKEKKEMIRNEYQKDEKYKSLDKIRLEKERIEYNLEQINSQFPSIAIALMIMLFSLLVPAISKVLANNLNSNLDSIIQILYSSAIFIYGVKTLSNTSDEFRCLRICKVVLEELEKENVDEIHSESNEMNNDIKDIKRFLGI